MGKMRKGKKKSKKNGKTNLSQSDPYRAKNSPTKA
jgi:hypothetical protein